MSIVLKAIVRGHYDLQKLRIQAGNRIIANFRSKLDIAPSDKAEKAALSSIKTEFAALPAIKSKKHFKGTPIIAEYPEYVLVKSYVALLESEKQVIKEITQIVNEHPLYISFLSSIKGIGPLMTGILLTEIDISKADTPAALWKYAGLDVTSKGEGRSRRAEHLVDREYTKADGTVATKKSITYNPRLKTKLMGVLAPSLIKQQSPDYAPVYYEYKTRLETSRPEMVKGHMHMMALRYMTKRFLKHLYLNWRKLENLSVTERWTS